MRRGRWGPTYTARMLPGLRLAPCRRVVAALLVLGFAQRICDAQSGEAPVAATAPAATAPSATAKAFTLRVDVTLSAKAAARLASPSEGIVVAASFGGEPTPAARSHAGEDGHVDLGSRKVEIPGRDGEAVLHGSTATTPLQWIQGPVQLNINVFSARHSSPDNLLSCDVFDGPLEHALGHAIPLHCSLIRESQPTKALK